MQFVFVIPRQLTTFKGEAKAVKLFAKHIKVLEMSVIVMLVDCVQGGRLYQNSSLCVFRLLR